MTQTKTSLELSVEDILEEVPDIKSFILRAPSGALPPWSPGAHIQIDIGDGQTRSYSLLPHNKGADRYRVGVLLEQNSTGGSAFMHTLTAGASLHISPPKNDFPLMNILGHNLLLAGGIGITPIYAMAAALEQGHKDFALHYAGRTRGHLAFMDEISALIGDKLVVHYDDDDSALDIKAVLQAAPEGSHIYVCGPKGMIEAVRTMADTLSIPARNVHFELFNTPAPQEGELTFEVEIASSGKVYKIPTDKTIVEVLEEAGEDPLYDCAHGDCGVCQTGVLSGEIDHRDVVLTDSEKAAGDVMQICVSRAKNGGRLVLDL